MGKFKCWKSENDGLWYFHLRADNDEIILQSEGYETKDGCLNGINSVKRNAPMADVEVEE